MSNEQEDQQALRLQQLFAEINNQSTEKIENEDKDSELIEIDVLNLPARSEIHQQSKLSWHIDMKRPFWRFLLVLLFIIGVVIGIYFMLGEQIILFFT